MSSYETKMTWWKGELTSGNRCSKCWLRMRECFCYKLTQFREEIYGNKAQNIRICIYYHFQEIGRSANTAHVVRTYIYDIEFFSVRFFSITISWKL
jgi:DTW domain-containing protein YfiP